MNMKPQVEELEDRLPTFSFLGSIWTGPVTWSVGAGVSAGEVSQALTKWSEVCNINFVKAAPGVKGDIHVTAKPIPGNVVGYAYAPGPGIGGDIVIDTDAHSSYRFNVILHEVGHAIGLGHSNDSGAVMYPYVNPATSPQRDDILGAQKLYGLRQHDRFDLQKSNYYRANASLIDAVFSDVANLRNGPDRDWYKFVARSNQVTVTIDVESSLAPSVRIGRETTAGLQWLTPTKSASSGQDVTLTFDKLVVGKSYYIFVDERPGSYWSFGEYRLNVSN